MATDPVVSTLREAITAAEGEKAQLKTQIIEQDSRITRLKTAIAALSGTTSAVTTTPIKRTGKKKSAAKGGPRPWYISEALVDKVEAAISGRGKGKTQAELAGLLGYSQASITDAVSTLMERKRISRVRAETTKSGHGSPPFLYWPNDTER